MMTIDPEEFGRACSRAGLTFEQMESLAKELEIHEVRPWRPIRQAHSGFRYPGLVNALIIGTALVIALLAAFWINHP